MQSGDNKGASNRLTKEQFYHNYPSYKQKLESFAKLLSEPVNTMSVTKALTNLNSSFIRGMQELSEGGQIVDPGIIIDDLAGVYNSLVQQKAVDKIGIFGNALKSGFLVRSDAKKIVASVLKTVFESTPKSLEGINISARLQVNNLDQDVQGAIKKLLPVVKLEGEITLEELAQQFKDNHKGVLEKLFSWGAGKEVSDEEIKNFTTRLMHITTSLKMKSNVINTLSDMNQAAISESATAAQTLESDVAKKIRQTNQYAVTNFVEGVASVLVGSSKTSTEVLVENGNKCISAFIISMDLQKTPISEKDIKSIEYYSKKASEMKDRKGTQQIIYDVLEAAFDVVASMLTGMFGSETSKIIDEVKSEYRQQIRSEIITNIKASFNDSLQSLAATAQKLTQDSPPELQEMQRQ
jgi:hypothetical protein